MDIAEVALRSGVPASTLRFYEEKGLIAPVGRRGLRRTFDPGVLERLALISLGAAAGFSLDEIGRMFTADGRPKIDRGMLADKAKQIDHTIARLTAMRDGLRHAAACPARSHMECPSFRRLLRAAASGRYHRPVDLQPGLRGSAGLVVKDEHTAPRVGSGVVPVLATPVMINLFEAAALAAVEHLLPPGHQSLGTVLDVRHIAATPVGMRVEATATVEKVEGRTLHFRVEARDERELIGDGRHERVVVNVAKFDARVQRKLRREA